MTAYTYHVTVGKQTFIHKDLFDITTEPDIVHDHIRSSLQYRLHEGLDGKLINVTDGDYTVKAIRTS